MTQNQRGLVSRDSDRDWATFTFIDTHADALDLIYLEFYLASWKIK